MPTDDVELLAQVAAGVHDQADEAGTVEAVVAQALEVVPDAEHVSLTVRRRNGFVTWASTSPLAARADELQYALDEGPCVGAATEAEWFRSGDVGADTRWRRWGPRAAELGVRSLMSVPLLARDERIGALNMYATRVGRFSEPEVLELAELYALHVAYALSAARKVAGLETALGTRHVIGVAQGILMERYEVDVNRAFEILRRASSVQNRKLRDIAHEFAATRRTEVLGLDVVGSQDDA